jgi:LysM repeat protein
MNKLKTVKADELQTQRLNAKDTQSTLSKVATGLGLAGLAGYAGLTGFGREKLNAPAQVSGDSGVPPQDPMGNPSPGTAADVSGTPFKPELKADEPPKFRSGADDAAEAQPRQITIGDGATLSQLAKDNKVSVNDIMLANPELKSPHKIMAGAKLNIPPATGRTIYDKNVGLKAGPNRVSESLLAAFNDVVNSKSPNLFAEAAKKNAKKLDPVGKEDEDIDNDGDKNTKTDRYLHNRRKAIRKAMEEAIDPKESGKRPAVEPKSKKGDMEQHVNRAGKGDKLSEASKDKLEIYRDMAGDNASEIGDDIHYMRNAKTGYGSKEEISKARAKLKKREAGIKLASKKIAGKGAKVSATESYGEEEIGFSEAELAHIASIVEGMPVAPTPEDQAPTPTPKNKAEGGKGKGSLAEARGRPPKEEGLGANELHMNAKRAVDNMANVTHKFANGEKVKMTKSMGVAFLNRHAAGKTSDDKDAILNYAHKSPDAFEKASRGEKIPAPEKGGIKLGSMKGK